MGNTIKASNNTKYRAGSMVKVIETGRREGKLNECISLGEG